VLSWDILRDQTEREIADYSALANTYNKRSKRLIKRLEQERKRDEREDP